MTTTSASRPQVPGYVLSDHLGAGVSSDVWAGERAIDRMPVAVKVVRAEHVADESAAREAAVLSVAAGEGVVSVHDVLHLDDGSLALVLDLVDGGSLSSVVRSRGHLTAGETVTVLSPVAAALGTLHGKGAVHGDVSATNVLLDRSGRPRLCDLGAARLRGDTPADVWTTTGFTAPEVLAGREPTAAADVYAVGALGWLCLTGSEPEAGPLRGRLSDVVVDPQAQALVGVVEGALRTDPAVRPQAHELAVQVFDAARAEPVDVAGLGEDVAALTHRLSDVARRTSGQDVATASRRDRPRRLAVPSVRWRRRGPARHGAARPHGVVRLVGTVLALAVLAVALVVLTPVGDGPSAAAGGATSGGGGGSGAGVSPAVAPLGVLEDQSAARVRPRAVLQALSDARATVWATGRTAALTTVDAPGSPALADDTARLGQAQLDRLRYVGLRLVVREARVVADGREVVTIRTRVDTTAYRVTGPTHTVSRPAEPGRAILVDLAWTDAGWRVSRVRAG